MTGLCTLHAEAQQLRKEGARELLSLSRSSNGIRKSRRKDVFRARLEGSLYT